MRAAKALLMVTEGAQTPGEVRKGFWKEMFEIHTHTQTHTHKMNNPYED